MTIFHKANDVDEIIFLVEKEFERAKENQETIDINYSPRGPHGIIVSVSPTGDDFTSIVDVELRFHEDIMVNEFVFKSSGGEWTDAEYLGPILREVVPELESEWEIPNFNFMSINSGSLSGNPDDGLGDREFTYEASTYEENIDF